jgi:uncharacterized protein YecE (DUF72 family)
MARILVGTASWTDKTLIASGRFYPAKENTPEGRLRYYAPTALPPDIAKALGPIKARNLYYKDAPAEIRDAVWQRFREGIEPLRASGKLVAVHFQFAPRVAFHPENFKHIDECRERLAGFQLSIEFRYKSWFDDKHAQRTLDFERERGLANVVVDEPQGMRNTIPSVWEVTTPKLAVVRLHGRNHGTWNQNGLQTSAERFNCDHNTAELTELAKMIRQLETQADLTQVIFNNLCGAPHKLFNAESIVMRRRRSVSVGQRPPLRDAHDRCRPSYAASVGPTPGNTG